MTAHTAISNTYYMEAAPKERTPIAFRVGKDRAHCYGCGRNVLPKIISTKFLSHPLAVCPHCQTVVQDPPKEKEERARTGFVWVCDGGHEYSEGAKLPVRVNEKGYAGRVCPVCGKAVSLVEE